MTGLKHAFRQGQVAGRWGVRCTTCLHITEASAACICNIDEEKLWEKSTCQAPKQPLAFRLQRIDERLQAKNLQQVQRSKVEDHLDLGTELKCQ